MSDQLQIFSGKRILLEYYNRLNRKTIDLSEVDFGKPARIDTAGTEHNTVVRIYPKLGTKYYGSPRLYYDRIHISLLGVISVEKGIATTVWEVIDQINEKYNVGITTEDVLNDTLPATTTGMVVVNLNVNPDSITFYDGPMIYTKNYPDPASLPPPSISSYCMWSRQFSSNYVTLINDGYTAIMNFEHTTRANMYLTRGKTYWEVTIDSNNLLIGVATPDVQRDSIGYPVLGTTNLSWVLNTATGKVAHGAVEFDYCSPIITGKTVGILLDMDTGEMSYIVDDVNLGLAFNDLNRHLEIYPVITGTDEFINSTGTGNFGETPFVYAVPTGVTPGIYVTYIPTPVTNPPPPIDGTGSANPPRGTLLGAFCQDEDKYGVFADGDGGFTIELIQSQSADCGYDPNNPFVISGGSAAG